MGQLRYVTLTGADENTDFAELARLSEEYFFVEWAVLYSPSKAGTARYPSLEWLESFADKANEAGMNIALHLCGTSVRDLLASFQHGATRDAATTRVLNLVEKFGRVQLNMRAKASDVEPIKRLLGWVSRSEYRTCVILQWNSANESVCQELAFTHGFEVLVDSSGGKGIERTDWPNLQQHHLRRVGYAGGLGPDNIAAQLVAISAAAGDCVYTVDMEGKLRDMQDLFDLARCAQVLTAAEEFDNARFAEAGRRFGTGVHNVAELDELWLDWWVGWLRGADMVIPPENACKAVYLDRQTGKYDSYQPSENKAHALRILSEERVSLLPLEDGTWQAQAVGGDYPAMVGKELHIAGLRAVVAKHRGLTVPLNPVED